MHLDINVKLYSQGYSIFSVKLDKLQKSLPNVLEITICNDRPGSIKILHARQKGVVIFYDVKNVIFIFVRGMKIFHTKNITKSVCNMRYPLCSQQDSREWSMTILRKNAVLASASASVASALCHNLEDISAILFLTASNFQLVQSQMGSLQTGRPKPPKKLQPQIFIISQTYQPQIEDKILSMVQIFMIVQPLFKQLHA